jgi:hypothetical protein
MNMQFRTLKEVKKYIADNNINLKEGADEIEISISDNVYNIKFKDEYEVCENCKGFFKPWLCDDGYLDCLVRRKPK